MWTGWADAYFQVTEGGLLFEFKHESVNNFFIKIFFICIFYKPIKTLKKKKKEKDLNRYTIYKTKAV